jgi:hypothetical protein
MIAYTRAGSLANHLEKLQLIYLQRPWLHESSKKSKRQFATLKLQEIFDEGLVATKGQSPGTNLPRLPLASSTRLKVLTIGAAQNEAASWKRRRVKNGSNHK